MINRLIFLNLFLFNVGLFDINNISSVSAVDQFQSNEDQAEQKGSNECEKEPNCKKEEKKKGSVLKKCVLGAGVPTLMMMAGYGVWCVWPNGSGRAKANGGGRAGGTVLPGKDKKILIASARVNH